MINQFLIVGAHVNELLERIEQIIDQRLSSLSPKTSNHSDYISRQEVADILKVSLPTLRDYTKLGWLQCYKIGNRVLYKRQEVEQSIEQVQYRKHKKGGALC